jgi:hypothetical protein
MCRSGEWPHTLFTATSSSAACSHAKAVSRTAPWPNRTLAASRAGSSNPRDSVSECIMEDYTEGMPMAGPQAAYSMAKLHLVVAPGALHRPAVDRK